MVLVESSSSRGNNTERSATHGREAIPRDGENQRTVMNEEENRGGADYKDSKEPDHSKL